MKTATLAISLALGATACTLSAQQSMPDMPGMNMPTPQQQPKAPAKPKPKQQQQSMPDMPGMDMGQHKQTNSPANVGKPNQKPPETMPEDMKGMGQDNGNKKAQRNAASEQDSVRQQAGQVGKKPDDKSDQQSIQVPIQDLQEPEALEFRTGGDMPAPELLGDIVSR